MVQLVITVAMLMSLGLLSRSIAFAVGQCEGDVAAFCQGAEGPKQVLGCLKQNFGQLSPQCQMHISQLAEAVREAHQDCEQDLFMLCLGVPPGSGQIIQCLKLNKDYLSPECRAGIANLLMSR